MCGICGFTCATGSAEDHEVLKAMCDIMAHRGPDGEGRYIADGIALGHRRLSLIDLEGGGQPMIRETGDPVSGVSSPAVAFEHRRGDKAEAAAADAVRVGEGVCARGQWSIVFNGEIYNYREIREDLRALGYGFSTDSDTEVLLVGFIAWGEAVLERLRGMFAFAVYDAGSHELFCARDFFGIKPFYYTVQPMGGGAVAQGGPAGAGSGEEPARDSGAGHPASRFIFASEIKSILEHPAYGRELNEQALAQYLCFQFSALHETFFKGIFKLSPGHCIRVHADGTCETRCYWRPEYRFDGGRTEQEAVDLVEQVMRESVRYHNVADVEVGSFLSSGIDSSYLAACLTRENPEIKTFTVGFSEYEGERDEIHWARELAQLLGIDNDAEHITEDDFWRVLPTVQWHMDEPSADPSAVALYFVDGLAARSVKAVLSGEGADEFFGGYRIYQAPLASKHASWLPKPLLHAGAKVLEASGRRGAHYLERASESVEDWYYTNANEVAFSPEERRRILRADVLDRLEGATGPLDARSAIGLGSPSAESAEVTDAHVLGTPRPQQLAGPVYAEVAGLDETARMQHVDLWFWLVGDILLKTDKMSMAHSLESRVPFLDREVFDLASTVPVSQKVDGRQTKLVLRQAAERAIPSEWAQKEKLGFPVPLASWLRKGDNIDRVIEAFASEEAARFFNVDELLLLLDEHSTGRADNSRRIWIVYSFLVWYRVFFAG